MGEELTDCSQIKEILDAYALGAASPGEATIIEAHAAECVRCWEELTKAQRAAALLALSIPLHGAPEALRRRVMARAAKERLGRRAPWPGKKWRLGWPAAAWGLAVAGVAALALAGFLEAQLTDLRGEKDALAREVQDLRQENSAAGLQLAQQRQIMAVLSHPDAERVRMTSVSSASQASALYGWSRSGAEGFLICEGLPSLGEGQVYQAWFVVGKEYVPAHVFSTSDGTCLIPLDLGWLKGRPDGIGITVEPQGGSAQPSGAWVVYANFQ